MLMRARKSPPSTWVPAVSGKGPRAAPVGPALGLTQIHVDAGEEVAAQHLVAGGQRQSVRSADHVEQLPGEDEALRRLRAVDEDDSLAGLGNARELLGPACHGRS